MNSAPLPRVIAVYGFLGSGKTTFLLNLAEKASAAGRKSAVVVNEAGDVPIDGKLFTVSGLPVREIFGGCICCSLLGDFIETLKALLTVTNLDYIFIEPSGMADAGQLFESIQKHLDVPLSRVLLLDGPRLPLLLKAAPNIIIRQLQAAKIVFLNKRDALTPDRLAELTELLVSLGVRVRVVHVSAKKGLPNELAEELLA
jgi:G3E family GTPase